MSSTGQARMEISNRLQVANSAAWLAMGTTILGILLLASLHILSPEFAPSWRMISEYAFGSYGWVLSAMFVCLALSTWSCAIALWPHIHTRGGSIGLWLLMVSGSGGAMASYFDIRHPVGHGIAGLLGVLGFPIAALLLSVALCRSDNAGGLSSPLLWLANLSWIAVVLLFATLAFMAQQMSAVNGGHLPQHAPKSLPPGVLALDGWADRLTVLVNCAWVFLAAHRTTNTA